MVERSPRVPPWAAVLLSAAACLGACGDDDAPVPDGSTPDAFTPETDGGDCARGPMVIEPVWIAGATGPRSELGTFGKPDAVFVDGHLLLAGDEDPAFEEINLFDIGAEDPATPADFLAGLYDIAADPGPGGDGPLEFRAISGFARNDADGRIYVVEQGNGRIQVLRPIGDRTAPPYYEHASFIGALAADPDNPADGEFVRLQAARTDSMGRLYVSDDARMAAVTARRDIQVFDPDGTFLFKFGDASYGALGTSGNLQEPENFVIDEARDRIYVCDEGQRTIAVFTFGDRSFVTRFGEGLFLGTPNGIDVDGDGNIYIVDEGNVLTSAIRIFDPDTLEEVAQFGDLSAEGNLEPGYFNSPDTLHIDIAEDVLVIADQGHDRIQGFSLSEIRRRTCL